LFGINKANTTCEPPAQFKAGVSCFQRPTGGATKCKQILTGNFKTPRSICPHFKSVFVSMVLLEHRLGQTWPGRHQHCSSSAFCRTEIHLIRRRESGL